MNTRKILTTISDEPYRLFFPLGILGGILGVSLWPLWFAGLLDVYPGLAHARIMTEGFFTAFILGFLGTAGPRMLEVKPLKMSTWGLLTFLWFLAQGASFAGSINLAEGAFILVILIFFAALGRRFHLRQGLPPPGFILVIASLLGAAIAALTQMPLIQNALPKLSPFIWISGRSFLTEIYVLLPILGAAPFFLGRFGALPPKHAPSDSPIPNRAWKQQAALCAIIGIGILTTLLLKSMGMARTGSLLKACLIAFFVASQIPWKYPSPVATIARIAQLGLLAMIIAPLAEAIWPNSPLAWRHLLLISGFQSIVVCVATWVVFAHAARHLVCLHKWPFIRFCTIGWSFAVITRMVAEWIPAVHQSHLVYAALFWIFSSALWFGLLLPPLRSED